MRKVLSVVFAVFSVLCTLHGEVLPRAEYPRPQFERSEWVNLNGEWEYAFDFSETGMEKGYADVNNPPLIEVGA